jgi:hypothetical protein
MSPNNVYILTEQKSRPGYNKLPLVNNKRNYLTNLLLCSAGNLFIRPYIPNKNAKWANCLALLKFQQV